MKQKKITHGSLFSGVGGMDLGFEKAGIETKWQCEIDEKASSVLAKHWPKVKRYKDIKELKGNEIEPVDIITFGSPCQDLSIAGKRKGLAGERSGLYFEAIRIIKEMQDATEKKYPQIAIWENVRGALSSNDGNDFHEALKAMAELGSMDISWRILNAANFGTPQRRLRIFVVADFRGQRAGKILAEPTRLLWHPTESKEQEKEITSESRKSIETTSKKEKQETTSKIVGTLAARDYKGVGNQYVNEHKLIITVRDGTKINDEKENQETYQFKSYSEYTEKEIGSTLKANGKKDSSDFIVKTIPILDKATREKTSSGGNGLGIGKENDLMGTLTSNDKHAIYKEITVLDGTRVNDVRTYQAGIIQTILSRWGTGGNNTPSILTEKETITLGGEHPNAAIGSNISPTITRAAGAGGGHIPIIIKKANTEVSQAQSKDEKETTAITERAGKPGGGKGILLTKEFSPTLSTSNPQRIATKENKKYEIRRLTPKECERLMGWDDDHTKWDDKGNEISDSARYKMIGNGISAPVAQFIGENIIKHFKKNEKVKKQAG